MIATPARMMSGAGGPWKPFLLIYRISKYDTASHNTG